MKVKMVGPTSGYGPHGYRSWIADEVVEVDDGDQVAVDWYRAHCAGGGGTILEDVKPKEPAKATVESVPRRGRPPLPRDAEGKVVRE